MATDELSKALTIGGKAERDARTDELKAEVLADWPKPMRAARKRSAPRSAR